MVQVGRPVLSSTCACTRPGKSLGDAAPRPLRRHNRPPKPAPASRTSDVVRSPSSLVRTPVATYKRRPCRRQDDHRRRRLRGTRPAIKSRVGPKKRGTRNRRVWHPRLPQPTLPPVLLSPGPALDVSVKFGFPWIWAPCMRSSWPRRGSQSSSHPPSWGRAWETEFIVRRCRLRVGAELVVILSANGGHAECPLGRSELAAWGRSDQCARTRRHGAEMEGSGGRPVSGHGGRWQ